MPSPPKKGFKDSSDGEQNSSRQSAHFFLKQFIRCLRLGVFESLYLGVIVLCFYGLSTQGRFFSFTWINTQKSNSPLMDCDFRSHSDSTTTPIQLQININEANETELTLLPHIGPSLANRIILYRTSTGPFQKVEDLQNVKGIGPKIVNQVKDFCTVE